MLGGYVLTAISIVQGLLLFPFYLNYIDISMYGYWLTILSILTLISIVNFGLSPVVLQRMSNAYAAKDMQKVSDYFINSLIVYIAISVLFLCISLVTYLFLEDIITVGQSDLRLLEQSFILATVTMILSFFNVAFRGFSTSLLRPLFPLSVMIILRILGILLVVFMLTEGHGLIAIPFYLLVVEASIFILLAINIALQYKDLMVDIGLDRTIIKELFGVSPSIFGAIVGDRMTSSSVPIIITLFLSAELTTLYILANKIAEILLQLVRVFISSIGASYAHYIKSNTKEEVASLVQSVIVVNLFISLVGFLTYILFNSYFITLWMGDDLSLDQMVITFIGAGTLLFALSALLRQMIFGFGEFKSPSIVSLVGSVVNLLLTLVLIDLLGIIAIPIAYMLSSLYLLFAFSMILNRHIAMRIRPADLLRSGLTVLILVASALYLTSISMQIDSWLLLIAYVCISMVISIVIIWVINRALLQAVYDNTIRQRRA